MILQLHEQGVEFSRVLADPQGRLSPQAFAEQIKPNTKMIAVTHASNVCGTILPIEEIGKLCAKEWSVMGSPDTVKRS